MSEFVTVARAEDVPPGERIVARLGRDFVAVFNVGGRFYAVEDRCSHEDVPLSDGALHGDTIECLQHGAIFDLATGKDLAPPAVSSVKTYETRVEDGALQIRSRK